MHIPARIAVAAVVLGALSVPVGIGVVLDTSQGRPSVATACDGPACDDAVRTELFVRVSGQDGRSSERRFDPFSLWSRR